jgi:hypothetical protein
MRIECIPTSATIYIQIYKQKGILNICKHLSQEPEVEAVQVNFINDTIQSPVRDAIDQLRRIGVTVVESEDVLDWKENCFWKSPFQEFESDTNKKLHDFESKMLIWEKDRKCENGAQTSTEGALLQ